MKKRVFIFVYSGLTTVCLGLIYGWSVFVLPLEKDLGWDRSETSLTFTISIIFLSIAVMLGGFYNKSKDKPFISLVFSGVLICTGFISASYSQVPLDFYIRYGALVGFGIGFAYVEILSVISKWYQKNLGVATGAIMMCYGLGAVILGAICTSLMDTIGWHTMFKYIGIIFGCMVVLEGLLLHIGCRNSSPEAAPAPRQAMEHVSVPPSQMLRSSEFYLIFIYIIMIASAGLCLMSHIVPCATSMGASAAKAVAMMGYISIFNGAGRLFFGFLYDRIGISKVLTLVASLFIITVILAILSVRTGNLAVLSASCALFGALYGSAPPTSAVIASRFYGLGYYSANYGILSMPPAFAALTGPYVTSLLYLRSGSYTATFYMLAGFAVIAFILSQLIILIAKRKGKALTIGNANGFKGIDLHRGNSEIQ